jgi:hypothetical protein
MKINRNCSKKDYIDSFKNFETLYTSRYTIRYNYHVFLITKKQAEAFSHLVEKSLLKR